MSCSVIERKSAVVDRSCGDFWPWHNLFHDGEKSIRFETAGEIGKLAVLVAMVLAFRPWEAASNFAERSIPCRDEDAVIEHWKSMRLIRQTKHSGNNVDLFVNEKAWGALPRATQIEIGTAAFCQIDRANKGGVARIDDLNGKELARVAKGQWISWKYPE